ncbi:MAG: hypothetical protein WCX31_01510 [Salinivirgaceae bacterium]|jgi:hypothetical protein
MANIRNLKKDINYVTSELVVECFTYNFLFPEKSQDELAAIISDSVSMKEVLIQQINDAKKSKNDQLKQKYIKIRKEFENQVETLAERLTKLNG